MQRWLSRLSGSFFIVAFLLMYEGWRAMRGERPSIGSGHITLYFIGALFSMVLGMMGVRQRHRHED